MKKTVKYEMRVNTQNLIGPTISITKKQYDDLLKGYTKAIAENHAKEQPEEYDRTSDRMLENEDYAKDFEVRTKEYEKYTETRHILCDFGYGGICGSVGSLVLSRYETKEGFYWK